MTFEEWMKEKNADQWRDECANAVVDWANSFGKMAFAAGRRAGLEEAAEIAELNHIGVSVRRYCQDTDTHEYSGNIAKAIRAKAGEP